MRGGLLRAADSGEGLDKRCLEACNAGSEAKLGLRADKWEIPAEIDGANTMMMRCLLMAALLASLATAHSVHAQDDERAGWFPFVIPDLADEQTTGSPIDLSFLSPEPAGAHGFLRPDGERIVDGRGEEVRLFGTNICDYHPMPPKEYASAIAGRLQQLGVNFIRFHYYDWDEAPRGILNPDRQTLNAEKLDQFDWLFANLKACGIYVDINLHVARGYRDMPDGWHWMGKQIDIFHRPYIDSQKQYARDLLTHVNPYTGLAYTDDPAVVFIELNNENTVLTGWERYARLPERFSGPLRERWNAWLAERYGGTEDLAEAWNAGRPQGPEMLSNGGFADGTEGWQVQNSGGAESTLVAMRDEDGRPFARWQATEAGTADWHLQFMQPSLPVGDGAQIVVTLRARGTEGGTLQLRIMQQQEPWRTPGSTVTFALTPEWQDFGAGWKLDDPDGIPLRLNIDCSNRAGTYDVADISMRRGVLPGLREGERVEDASVPLPADTGSRARATDYVAFLMALERDYYQEMRDYIRGELGAQSMLFDTQVSYGGLAGHLRESGLGDAIDCHAYPAHPRNVEDEHGHYRVVNNVSMLGRAFGSLESMAVRRVAGKPFVVTEFDLNPPNDHASESYAMLALMSAYQGWSGFGEYSWYNFQQTYGHSRIRSNFATTGHAGQITLMPPAALIYRLGLVQPAEGRATLVFHEDDVPGLIATNVWYGPSNLWGAQGGEAADAWRTGLAARALPGSGDARVEGEVARSDGPIVSDTGELTVDRTTPGREHLAVTAPAARMLIGYVAGGRYGLGDALFEVGESTRNGYANIALVALDGLPVAESRRLLLAAVARVENRGQKWNEARTGVYDWGEGPTLAEPVPLRLTLPGRGWRAQALAGTGRPTQTVAMPGATLATDPSRGTLWYLIER
jgi:hypothetical protein